MHCDMLKIQDGVAIVEKTIELNKHWNDNSSIRSDLRLNRRWRKLMYDNYEGRKNGAQHIVPVFIEFNGKNSKTMSAHVALLMLQAS